VGAVGKSAALAAGLRTGVRRGWVVGLAIGALIAAFALSKAQPKAQPIAGDDAPVLAADLALGDAMRAGDKAAARRLLALQFTLVDADGKIFARKDVLADLKSVVAAPANDTKVRSYGFVAVVTGSRKSARGSDVFFLDIWVRQKGAWRALLIQDVAIRDGPSTGAIAPTPAADLQSYECKNPCQAIPYRVRSAAEQEVINAFQTVMKAIVAHDANEWGQHVADEFVVYASNRAPIPKSGRIAAIERQKESQATVAVDEVRTMRLAVYGDGAVMIATDGEPDESRPSQRVARVWVKRDGRWLMALSAHTGVKEK
jgi:Domain of unknown function (DUF4440)